MFSSVVFPSPFLESRLVDSHVRSARITFSPFVNRTDRKCGRSAVMLIIICTLLLTFHSAIRLIQEDTKDQE
jgi:hypothetical protein